eukprot:gnl/TRDRNA2_/TRDRNA2_43311_c0_seq1.p1 gnl/TRDRNA2_/TRDRNA2_43311_c0~~gnl/TRDRNA2_/TRDRNA2_43311_c0_seq1.p1  ORF type:complete len:381 (+),score=97.55 gnl/TRDRNA2_/TRDRNA2_43311_c0_seq1:100-1242(+)
MLPPGERDELFGEVEAVDKAAEEAAKKGDTQQHLVQLERGLFLRRRLYAENSPEVTQACRRLCEVCNQAATTMLQKSNLRGAHDLLKRAEQVAEKSDLDRAITWNNLACYYRRIGKLRAAVSFLERALVIEEHLREADAAQTHLNLCATLSQLQRHADALYHAQSALIRIYELLTPVMLQGGLSIDGGPPKREEDQHEYVVVLCIAYHNLAVEHEYLKNIEAAVCTYAEGVRWATRFLVEGHQLAGILKESMEALKPKLPANSVALKRAAEHTEDWGKARAPRSGASGRPAAQVPPVPAARKATSDGGSEEDGSDAQSGRYQHLITPRGDRSDQAGGGDGDEEDKIRSSPTPQQSQGTMKSNYSKSSMASYESEFDNSED